MTYHTVTFQQLVKFSTRNKIIYYTQTAAFLYRPIVYALNMLMYFEAPSKTLTLPSNNSTVRLHTG